MSTKVYGCSDDLIEVEGDVCGETSPAYSSGDDEKPALLIFSDGTILSVVYGKPTNGAIWSVNLVRQGAQGCDPDGAEPCNILPGLSSSKGSVHHTAPHGICLSCPSWSVQ